jgi:hypothetical protein
MMPKKNGATGGTEAPPEQHTPADHPPNSSTSHAAELQELGERMRANFPNQYRRQERWVMWRLEEKKDAPGEFAKVPYYAIGNGRVKRYGEHGTPEDLKKLVTFEQALAAAIKFDATGVGKCQIEGDDNNGIDLDHIRDADGKIKVEAKAVLDAGSYAEESPSGDGAHLWLDGPPLTMDRCPDIGNGVGFQTFPSVKTAGFLTCTGKPIGGYRAPLRPIDAITRERFEALLTEHGEQANAGKQQAAGGEFARIPKHSRNMTLASHAGKLRRMAFDQGTIRVALLDINERFCDPPLPDSEIAGIAKSVARYDAHDWRKPLNIFAKLTAPPLTEDDVPPVIGRFAVLQARAAGFDATGTILAGVIAACGMIDDGFQLQLPGSSGWYESARLWGAAIGGPSAGKSPGQKKMMGPIFAAHRELIESSAADLQRAPAKRGDKESAGPALYSSDATIEKLSEILAANPRGLLYSVDEFESWLASHDAYRGNSGGSRDRGEWLRLYDGGPHQVDRINRGSFFVSNWGVSILSATTPAVLEKLKKLLPNDGLLQRFLLFITQAKQPRDDTVALDDIKAAETAYAARLLQLQHYHADPNRRLVRMNHAARGAFEAEETRLQALIEPAESLSASFASHVGKHVGMLARLILAFHCAMVTGRPEDTEVHADTVHLATRFMRKAFQHAYVIYGQLIGDGVALDLPRALARSILASSLTEFTRANAVQSCRAFKTSDREQQHRALQVLGDYGWVAPQQDGGGFGARWTVNPLVHALFINEAEEARRRRAAVREAIEQVVADRADSPE